MITDLDSPFTRRKRHQVLREKEHISIQEALRLTNKTLRLMELEEPEPDYSDDCEDHERDVIVPDSREPSDNDYDLVDVQSHGSQLQSFDRTQSGTTSALDELDPYTVRQKIRQHLIGSRNNRRGSVKDIFQQIDTSRKEEHAEGGGRALPVVKDHEYMDRVMERTHSSKVSYAREALK